jgi:hypothetical protein
MSAVDAAWSLYREGPGRRDEATELARGVVEDSAADPDDVARAGVLLITAGAVPDAIRARDTALARGASPLLLARLDTVCELARGDGRAARRALGTHLARTSGGVDEEVVSLASQAGAPLLAWRAGALAGLGPVARLAQVARAGLRRAPYGS